MTKAKATPDYAGTTFAGLAAPVSAAPTLVQIMTAIQTALDSIAVLRTTPYIPEQVNPPQAVVGVPPIPEYHKAFKHGMMELDFTILLIVSKAYDRVGQTALGEFADFTGTNSIHAAIEADQTLGGVVNDCFVVGFRPTPIQEVGALSYYGGEFTVRVLAKGA